MATSVSKATNNSAVDGGNNLHKHRACDECRSRKLACTKEPEGCARCKREGVACHYSLSKPMGRPRKRQHVEISDFRGSDGEESATAADFSFLQSGTIDDFDLFAFLDPGLSAQNAANGLGPTIPAATEQHSSHESNFDALDFGTIIGGVDGTTGWPPASEVQPSSSRCLQTPLSSINHDGSSTHLSDSGTTPNSHSLPSLSPPQSGPSSVPSPETCAAGIMDPALFPNRRGTTSCPCLAQLYLALDSLQNMPDEVAPAMACARNAARTAYRVAECASCSPPQLTEASSSFQPSLQGYQNMMMLGALLPSIANAYNRILSLIDGEVAAADRDGRSLPFSFEQYGGLWGRLGGNGSPAAAAMEEQLLTPANWRSTVCALLRVDVYGYKFAQMQGGEVTAEMPASRQIGLKDIVDYLLERQRLRHATMDEMFVSGQLKSPHPPLSNPGEKHNCERILEVARISIENLAIS